MKSPDPHGLRDPDRRQRQTHSPDIVESEASYEDIDKVQRVLIDLGTKVRWGQCSKRKVVEPRDLPASA